MERISADVREVVAREEVRDKLVQLGALPAASTPAPFSALIDNDRRRYTQIIKDRKITIH